MTNRKAATQPLPLRNIRGTASGGQGWKQLLGKGHSGYQQPWLSTESSRLYPSLSLQSRHGASPPSLLSLLAHQTSAASGKTRAFPILPASNPSGCGAEVLFTAGYPPSPTFFPGASTSCFSRDQGIQPLGKRHPCPFSSWKKLTRVDTREGAGRTQVLSHAWDTLPPVTTGQWPGDRECHASRAGQLHKRQCMLTPTSEAWAGAQSWLYAGHPSTHKQPSFLGKCRHFAFPWLPLRAAHVLAFYSYRIHSFAGNPLFFVGHITQPKWPSLSTAQ